MKIAHISDLHMGQGNNGKKFNNLNAMARAVVGSGADVCVATGDFAEHATAEEYRMVAPSLKYICSYMPLEMTPGNHDGGALGIWGTRKRYRNFHDMAYEVLRERRDHNSYPLVSEHQGVQFIGVDSVWDVFLRPWSVASGRVGAKQLQKLEGLLKECDNAVVYLHHHPFYRGIGLKLHDAKEFCRIARNAKLVLYGHKHVAHEFEQFYASDQTPASRRFRLIDLDDLSWKWVRY